MGHDGKLKRNDHRKIQVHRNPNFHSVERISQCSFKHGCPCLALVCVSTKHEKPRVI